MGQANVSRESSRERILQKAAELFVERGYRGLSMREIAEEVGMSKPAIYYHFADKEQLFIAVLDAALGRLAALIAQEGASGAPWRACIERIVTRMLGQPAEERAAMRLATQEMAHLSAAARAQFLERYEREFIGALHALVAAGIAAGEFRPVDAPTATWALLGILYPYFNSRNAPAPGTVGDLLGIYFDGIGQRQFQG